jgi:hypothetical protein
MIHRILADGVNLEDWTDEGKAGIGALEKFPQLIILKII